MSGIPPFPSGAFIAAHAAVARNESSIIALAQRLVRSAGPRLRAEAARINGENGLAQADALIDIVTDGDCIPESWPIDEMIDLLATGGGPEQQSERLVRDLCALAWRIDALADQRAAILGRASSSRAA